MVDRPLKNADPTTKDRPKVQKDQAVTCMAVSIASSKREEMDVLHSSVWGRNLDYLNRALVV